MKDIEKHGYIIMEAQPGITTAQSRQLVEPISYKLLVDKP